MAKNLISMESIVVSAFKEVIKNVAPTEGKIAFAGNSRNVIVSSTWNQRNVERKSTMQNKFVQMVELDCHEVTNLHSYDNTTEIMSSYSPSFEYRGVFRDVPPSGKSTAKRTHLELWQYNKLLKLVDLTAVDAHGDVYTDGEFGCFDWSPCMSKILYTAEKKKKKTEPFLPTPTKPSEDVTYGEEYVWVEDWGETLVGKVSPVLAVWDSTKNEVSIVSPVSTELSVGPGLWAPDGTIVCVGWETFPRRLGKVYCTNRESRLLHIETDGNATPLTKKGLSVMSPKFSKDGSKLIWLERDAGGAHHSTMRIMKMDWATKEISTLVDIVQTSTATSNGEKFFGIYTLNLRNCWVDDDKTIIVSSEQRASTRIYAIDTETQEIVDITGCSAEDETFSRGVLDVRKDLILSWSSSLLSTPALQIGRYTKSEPIEWITLIEPTPTLTDFLVDVIRMESKVEADTAKDFSAIYFGPKTGRNVPLIVFPHGGPHSVSTNSYSSLITFFGRLGFATLLVNYRGSIGAGEASVKALLGKVGTVDVSDCHQSALTALEKYSEVLSKEKCLLFGGSHGGFLVLHLSGQYPTQFKSTVALNPVVDLTGFFSSDIPDWALIESGYSPTAGIDETMFSRMKKMSPIHYVENMESPVLFLIGKSDLRVPPSQGINCHYILKARGIKTKLLAYEDTHGLPKVPHEVDFAINTILWFSECIQHDFPPSE